MDNKYTNNLIDSELPPESALSLRVINWLKSNFFSSPFSIFVTFAIAYLIYKIVPPMFNWVFVDSTVLGQTKEDCLVNGGACWVFIKVRIGVFMYGFYPLDERWRIDFSLLLLLFSFIPVMFYFIKAKVNLYRAIIVSGIISSLIYFYLTANFSTALLLFVVQLVPLLSLLLKTKKSLLFFCIVNLAAVVLPLITIMTIGGVFNLAFVATDVWGGLFLTIVVAFIGILGSIPIGIVLALARRSKMPVVRTISTVYIEFIRGVPLISVLFMASIMLPLFLPEGVSFNKLLRALIGVAFFYAAYIAEVVRGGLQGIGSGQYEGADSLGLGYWQKHRLIILPQALRLVIPGIINTVLGLFKDTTLVAVIGLFDLLGTVKTALADTQWLGFSKEAYFFAAIVFWIFCYLISQYGKLLEKRLSDKQKSNA